MMCLFTAVREAIEKTILADLFTTLRCTCPCDVRHLIINHINILINYEEICSSC